MTMYAVSHNGMQQIVSATISGRHWRTGMAVEVLGHAYTVDAITPAGGLTLGGRFGATQTIPARLVSELIRAGCARVVA